MCTYICVFVCIHVYAHILSIYTRPLYCGIFLLGFWEDGIWLVGWFCLFLYHHESEPRQPSAALCSYIQAWGIMTLLYLTDKFLISSFWAQAYRTIIFRITFSTAVDYKPVPTIWTKISSKFLKQTIFLFICIAYQPLYSEVLEVCRF